MQDDSIAPLRPAPGALSPVSVVTGAAGFVGQALVQRLLQDGDAVRALVLAGDPAVEYLRRRTATAGRVEIIEGDVTDAASIASAFTGATRVFHTAALIHAWAPWARFRQVNVGGTQNVARAALAVQVNRLVHVSTSDVFGIPRENEVLDESAPFRRWHEPYADTKIEAEESLWRFSRETALPLTVVYPGWVYGPGDRAFFPGLARAITDGFMLFWRRNLRLAWSYIDNLADACVLASTHPAAIGHGYLVHDGDHGPTLQDVCGQIADRIGVRRPTRHLPYGAAFAAAWLLQGAWKLLGTKHPPPLLTVDVKAFGTQWHLSNRRVREELGWRPRVASEAGMRAALDDLVQLLHTNDAHPR
jgi:nucleoside-diphosphate-sugar epimerase